MITVSFSLLFYVITNFYKIFLALLFYLFIFFFHENCCYFFMFRDVPECSVFRVLSTPKTNFIEPSHVYLRHAIPIRAFKLQQWPIWRRISPLNSQGTQTREDLHVCMSPFRKSECENLPRSWEVASKRFYLGEAVKTVTLKWLSRKQLISTEVGLRSRGFHRCTPEDFQFAT